MGFLLNDEQRQLGDSASEFLNAQSPISLQRRLRDERAPLGFEPALWQQVVDLGWPAAVFPEEYDGLAVGYLGLGAVFEAMGRTLAALPLLSSVVLCGELLLAAGSKEQRQRWLPRMVHGSARLALALDEQGRHHPERTKTRARRNAKGDGWVLDGEKWFVIDGIGAPWLIVVARVLNAQGADDGLGLFMVEAMQAGVTLAPTLLADSRNQARLTLSGVQVPDNLCLNAGLDTAQALDAALDRARTCLAAEALGLLREAFERTNAYLKERVQFDVPIGSFQALQHRMARLYTELEMLQSCVRAALSAIDTQPADLALLASLAKARASDLCERLMNEAVQLHGGIGVTDEFDLGLMVKRARVLQHSLGDGVFHRERYAQLKGLSSAMTSTATTAATSPASPAAAAGLEPDLLALAARCREQLTAPGAPFELVSVELNGQTLAAYRNAFATLPQLLNAGRVHGEREFMVYESDRWTFDRFYQAVDALAGRLQAEHGVRTGDRVSIAMRNRPEWAVAFVAVALLGAVPAPLNSFGLREELLSGLRDVQPRWLLCDPERFAHVQADLAALGCRAAVVGGAPGQGDAAWPALIAPGAPVLQPPTLALDDAALILFTSGASSQAKGVLSTQRAVCQAMHNIDYIGTMAAMTSSDMVKAMMARGLQPTTLTAVPLFHISGLHAQLLASLRHGRRLVFMRRWNPAQALKLIQTEKITQFNGAPSMVMQLLAEPSFDDPAVTGSLGGVGFGGAGLPQRLIDDMLERRANAMAGTGFGLTESNGVGAASSGLLFKLRPQTSGLLSPIIELRVAEFDGTPLPEGEAGELWLRGVTLMQGYCNQPEATARAMEGGWFHTGDIGMLDADGFVRVVDRIKDVINRAGEKIAAAEVESCLLQHPHLVEAAVFAQPDDQTGEAVVAVVVLAHGAALTAAEVQAHVAARLAAYKVPKQVHVRLDSLPRNPAGKMLKVVLKREYTAA